RQLTIEVDGASSVGGGRDSNNELVARSQVVRTEGEAGAAGGLDRGSNEGAVIPRVDVLAGVKRDAAVGQLSGQQDVIGITSTRVLDREDVVERLSTRVPVLEVFRDVQRGVVITSGRIPVVGPD